MGGDYQLLHKSAVTHRISFSEHLTPSACCIQSFPHLQNCNPSPVVHALLGEFTMAATGPEDMKLQSLS